MSWIEWDDVSRGKHDSTVVVEDTSHAGIQLREARSFARPSSFKLLVWAPALHQPSPKGVLCKAKGSLLNLKARFSAQGALRTMLNTPHAARLTQQPILLA